MPEEPEIEVDGPETKDGESGKHATWIQWIAVTTAVFAVVGAIGASRAGALVNGGLISQIQSSDTWNEFEANRQKVHIYTVALNQLADQSAISASVSAAPSGHHFKPVAGERAMTAKERIKAYTDEISRENSKNDELQKKAKDLEESATQQIEKHEKFAQSVAFVQVAIGLGAIASLTKVKSVWYIGLASGLIGLAMFAWGFMH